MELSLFSYEPKNSPLTRVHPGLKLSLLLISIILLLYLNLYSTLTLFCILIVVSSFLGFSLNSQLKDFRPILIYILFFYIVSIFIQASQIKNFSIEFFIPNDVILLSMIRLLVTVQVASLFYKTTTTIQLKYCLERFEIIIRKLLGKLPFLTINEKPSITFIFTLVISFIPRILKLWNQLKLAWIARGGSTGLSMLSTLFPQLLTLAFNDAENTWQAILSRENEIE